MPRFFVSPESIEGNVARLDPAETTHAIRVFRLRDGEAVELLDGRGRRYRGVLKGVDGKRARVAIRERLVSEPPSPKTTLAVSLIKQDRMEWLLEKACELGAWAIWPIAAERTVVRVRGEEIQRGKEDRWRRILLESCKQSGRAWMPELRPCASFRELLDCFAQFDLILLATLAVPSVPLKQALPGRDPKNVLFIVGPEGDFTQEEARQAVGLGAIAVSLGDEVLRSETAALYLLSAGRLSCGLAVDS